MGAYENMIARLPAGTDLQEGSFAADNLRAVAAEIDAVRGEEIDYLPSRFFPTLAEGEDLTLAAANFGIKRKAARAAEVMLRISGTPGAVVAAGIRAVGDGIYFEVTRAAVIGADKVNAEGREGALGYSMALVPAEAIEPGAEGNVPATRINKFVTTYAGLTGVINPAAAYGGTDTETDADLRLRVEQRWRNPSTGGNAADYIRWALAVSGVSRARVFNPSAGNVDLYIVGTGNVAASAELLAKVAADIAAVKPLGATLSVLSAEAVSIDVAATVLLADGYTLADVAARITEELEGYVAEVSFTADIVSYAKLLNTAFVEGAVDVVEFTVNGGTASVTLGATEFPTPGVISIDQG